MAFTNDQPIGNSSGKQSETGLFDEQGNPISTADFGAFPGKMFNAAGELVIDPATQTGLNIEIAGTSETMPPGSGYAQPDLGAMSVGSVFSKAGIGPDITDPSAVRLQSANLLPGGGRAAQNQDPEINYTDDQGGIVSHDSDWRVRITLAKAASVLYRQDGAAATILAPLAGSGVIFPYTPNITVTHVANYSPQDLTHANYQSYFYKNSEVQQITVTGDFTAQNHDEARYVLAVLYFFRAATKMFYGSKKDTGALAGSPPPMVFLNGYGKYYFPNVPCAVTSFQHTMPPDVDYIPVIPTGENGASRVGAGNYGGEETRIPTSSQISVTLIPMYSRKNIYDNFSLNDFAQGKLLGNKISGTGGFI